MEINKLSPQQTKQVEQKTNLFNAKLETTSRNTGEMGKNEFLKILTVQLSHQNPLQPMDNTKFISQMAQFTSLEQMQNMNKTLGDLKGDFSEIKSTSLIGKKAKYFDLSGNLKEGIVSEIKLQSQNKVVINQQEVALKDIDSIQNIPFNVSHSAGRTSAGKKMFNAAKMGSFNKGVFHPPMSYRKEAAASYESNTKQLMKVK